MEDIYVSNEYHLIVWGAFMLLISGCLAFGPPSLMRYYDPTRSEEEQSFLITWNRIGGILFFILGHLVLLFSLVNGLINKSFIKSALVILIFFAELYIAYKFKLIKLVKYPENIVIRTLIFLPIWIITNLGFFIFLYNEKFVIWIILIVTQIIIGIPIIWYSNNKK